MKSELSWANMRFWDGPSYCTVVITEDFQTWMFSKHPPQPGSAPWFSLISFPHKLSVGSLDRTCVGKRGEVIFLSLCVQENFEGKGKSVKNCVLEKPKSFISINTRFYWRAPHFYLEGPIKPRGHQAELPGSAQTYTDSQVGPVDFCSHDVVVLPVL